MTLRYRLRGDATLHDENDELLLRSSSRRSGRFRRPSPGVRAMLLRLDQGGGSIDELIAEAQRASNASQSLTLFLQLQQLKQRGWLSLLIDVDNNPVLVLEPFGNLLGHRPESGPFHIRWTQYLQVRTDQTGVFLESPLTAARLWLLDPRLAMLLPALASPCSAEQLPDQLHADFRDDWQQIVLLLMSAGLVGVCDAEGRVDVDREPEEHGWNAIDLAFHHHSRGVGYQHNIDATFDVDGVSSPPPSLLRPCTERPTIPLSQPGPLEPDPGFFNIIEKRCSIRHYSELPPDLDQLSLLLWYTARIKHRTYCVFAGQDETIYGLEGATKPVAACGALHEIDLYLTIHRCTGLRSGLYRYEPQQHQLLQLSNLNTACEKLLVDAGNATGRNQPPDILITLAARYGRLSWKYKASSYSMILKDAGAIYQQLYLVSTAVGLAPCAIGSGNSQTFAKAAGLEGLAEIPVGEFMLGRHE